MSTLQLTYTNRIFMSSLRKIVSKPYLYDQFAHGHGLSRRHPRAWKRSLVLLSHLSPRHCQFFQVLRKIAGSNPAKMLCPVTVCRDPRYVELECFQMAAFAREKKVIRTKT
jgi:hypothetical protein